MRAVARQALTIVPVLGWAIKGGVGYTGTLAMGKAAVQYFEDGNDLGQVLANFRGMVAEAATKRPRRGRRTVADLPASPAVADLPAAQPAADPHVPPALPADDGGSRGQ